jgi:hypothetical protein
MARLVHDGDVHAHSLSCRKLLPPGTDRRVRHPSPSPQRPCKDVNLAAGHPVPGPRIPAPAIKTSCGIQTLPSSRNLHRQTGLAVALVAAGSQRPPAHFGAGSCGPGPGIPACPLVLLIPSCWARVRDDLAEVWHRVKTRCNGAWSVTVREQEGPFRVGPGLAPAGRGPRCAAVDLLRIVHHNRQDFPFAWYGAWSPELAPSAWPRPPEHRRKQAQKVA